MRSIVGRFVLLAALVACGGSSSDKAGVAVELASVTLADDCGDHGYRAPPSTPPPEAKKERAAANETVSQDVAARSAGSAYAPSCSQTSIQISFSSDHADQVTIKKVELLDATGKYIQDLAARSPSRWNGSQYEKWDEKLGMDAKAQGTGFQEPEADKVAALPLSELMIYAEHVSQGTTDYLKSLDDTKLDHASDPDRPRRTISMMLRNFVIAHGWWHLGEIRYLKGMQGMPAAR